MVRHQRSRTSKASGAIFDPSQLTAAHRTLPLGTCVRVTHLGNGRFVVVPIIDRGPYIHGRLIDLSEAAAQILGMKWTGLAQVRIDVVPSCLKEMRAWPITRLRITNALTYNCLGAVRLPAGASPRFLQPAIATTGLASRNFSLPAISSASRILANRDPIICGLYE